MMFPLRSTGVALTFNEQGSTWSMKMDLVIVAGTDWGVWLVAVNQVKRERVMGVWSCGGAKLKKKDLRPKF